MKHQRVGIVVGVGILIRLALYPLINQLGDRVEFDSPLTSFARLREGSFLLFQLHMDPYSGDYLHMPPWLALPLMHLVEFPFLLFVLFLVFDTLSTLLLVKASGRVLAGAIFFLNPYAILSSLTLSAESVHILVALLCLGSWHRPFWLALLVLLKPVAPLVLLFPMSKENNEKNLVLKTGFWLIFFCLLSWCIAGDSYLYSTLVSPLLITSERTPNLGMWWALFTVMFPASVPLFRLVANTHLLLLVGPIFLRKENSRNFVHLTMCAVLLFQPYPTVLDWSLLLALLLVFPNMDRLGLVATQFSWAAQTFSTVTASLWLDRNTGNPNFLFHLNMVGFVGAVVALGQAVRALRLEKAE